MQFDTAKHCARQPFFFHLHSPCIENPRKEKAASDAPNLEACPEIIVQDLFISFAGLGQVFRKQFGREREVLIVTCSAQPLV